jgi:hypothetical protein
MRFEIDRKAGPAEQEPGDREDRFGKGSVAVTDRRQRMARE